MNVSLVLLPLTRPLSRKGRGDGLVKGWGIIRSYMRRFRSHRPGLRHQIVLRVFCAVTGVLIIQLLTPNL